MSIKTQEELLQQAEIDLADNGIRKIKESHVRNLFKDIIDTLFSLISNITLAWSSITGKPTSTVVDIDDAVSKRHTQNTDKQIRDVNGDTWITVDETGLDANKIVAKANKTGSGIISEWRNASNTKIGELLANGRLNLYFQDLLYPITLSLYAQLGTVAGKQLMFTHLANASAGHIFKNSAGALFGISIAKALFVGSITSIDEEVIISSQSKGLYANNKIIAVADDSISNEEAILGLCHYIHNSANNNAEAYSGMRMPSGQSYNGDKRVHIFSSGGVFTEFIYNVITLFGDKMAIGHSLAAATLTEQLEIINTTKIQGLREALSTKTANYTVTKANKRLLLNAESNTILIQLLEVSSSNHGQIFNFKAINVDNLITIIAFNSISNTISTITNPSGTTFRYTILSGSLAAMNVGDWVKITGATNAGNRGVFQVTGTDNSSYFDVTNAAGVVENPVVVLTYYQLTKFDYDMTVLNETIEVQCDNDNLTYVSW